MADSDNLILDDTTARAVLAVRAFDSATDAALWTADDRRWATQLARQTAGESAAPARFVAERARHALQRLAPRVPALRAWLDTPAPRPRGLAAAVGLGLLLGVAADQIGAQQRINLLAPPVWAILAWNLAVYLFILFQAALVPRAERAPSGGALRRALQALLLPAAPAARDAPAALHAARLEWTQRSAPLNLARAARWLHVAAAALALGLIAGMYLRGLVLDYRAGWQSTFLEAGTVQSLLGSLLAPASRLTGIAVPEVAQLRIAPEGLPQGVAAPWLHLYAATLALWVVVPRLALAGLASVRAWRLQRAFPLPWHDAYFQQLWRERGGQAAQVRVMPLGAAPSAQAALALRALLATELGDDVQVHVAEPTPFDTEPAAALESGAALTIAWLDLAATPEAESQGRFVRALQARRTPLWVLVDEAAFVQRFAAMPQRLAERRAAWAAFGRELAVPLCCADLRQPDADTAAAARRSIALALSFVA